MNKFECIYRYMNSEIFETSFSCLYAKVYTLHFKYMYSKNERYTENYLGNISISVVVKAELYKFINIMILLSFFYFFTTAIPVSDFSLHIVTHRYPYRRYHFSYFAAFRHFTPQ